MRVFASVALSALALVGAGCGASVSGLARGAELGGDAAALVPADASAYVAVDADLGSMQWQRVDTLTKSFPVRPKILESLRAELQKRGLTWKDDVEPALGPEVDVALIGTSDYVAFAKPKSEAKLRALATKLSDSSEQYTVEQIGEWSVVADSKELFDKVRAAQSGTSLADVSSFKSAWASVDGDALARAYVGGRALAAVPKLARLGSKTEWIAARVSADGDALRVEVVRHPAGTATAATQTLLGHVPSGASLAVAFHGSSELSRLLSASGASSPLPLTALAPLLNGDGVLYIRSMGIVPQVGLELTPKNPAAAQAALRQLIRRSQRATGIALPLITRRSGGHVFVGTGSEAIGQLQAHGPKLVGDSDYKSALAAAGVPSKTTFVVYANVAELAPFVQLLAQAVGGKAPDPALLDNLGHVDKLVAWGSKDGAGGRLSVWLRPR